VKATKNNNQWTRSLPAASLASRDGHPACRRGRPVVARTGAQSSQSTEHGKGHSVGHNARLYDRQHARRYLPGPIRPTQTSWSVRSVTDSDGRRLITLGRLPNGARTFLPVAPRRKGNLKLRATFAPESLSAFQPLIRRPRPLRRSLTYPSGLHLLNSL
jgi:hypothetical protein